MKSLCGPLLLGWITLGLFLGGCGGSNTAPTPGVEGPEAAPAPVEAAPAEAAPAPAEAAPAPAEAAPAEAKPLTMGRPKGDVVLPIAEGRSDAELRGCQTDADCAVTCRRDGHCCPDLCTCETVYNTAFIAQLDAAQAHCDARKCPVARCAPPAYTVVPVCQRGLCAARKDPN